jgi:hypothetical protein
MSNISVTTTVVQLNDPDVSSVIQNLGTGILYIDTVNTVAAGSGLKVASGASVPVGGGHTYYGVSDGTSDVRVLPGGTGSPA